MWKDYELPLFAVFEEQRFHINTDWRNIIDIFECLNTDELLFQEKIDCVLDKFYENYTGIPDINAAMQTLYLFINGNKTESKPKGETTAPDLHLIDWNKDLPLIIPPVNKVLGYDVRDRDYLHWWTFLGGFHEIGECTFRTYVTIREKLGKRQKLEKWEREIYLSHRDEIDIKKHIEYDNFDDEDILVQMAKQAKQQNLIE